MKLFSDDLFALSSWRVWRTSPTVPWLAVIVYRGRGVSIPLDAVVVIYRRVIRIPLNVVVVSRRRIGIPLEPGIFIS